MQIDKQQIIDMLRGGGDEQKVQQAEQDLPGQVDTDNTEHRNLLERLGVNPADIVSRLGGGGFNL